jgi:hypothetical protein
MIKKFTYLEYRNTNAQKKPRKMRGFFYTIKSAYLIPKAFFTLST